MLIEIEIPYEFVEIARDWHSGSNSMLYAIASTGNLTLGSVIPYNDDENKVNSKLIYKNSLRQTGVIPFASQTVT